MKKMIQLNMIHSQEWEEFITYRLWRKQNTIGIISVDPSKIISYRLRIPKKDSESFRKDYPSFTEITFISREILHVVETPEIIEKLIG